MSTARASEEVGAGLDSIGGMEQMDQIDIPEIVEEVRAVFEAYERALVENDVPALETAFWEDSRALRFGLRENHFGHAEIAAFRAGRSAANLSRTLERTEITTFGRDFATVNTAFRRHDSGMAGRQSQVWVRFPDGWRVTSAHVSFLPE